MSGLAGKKAVLVFPSFDLGGAERQGLMLARHLKEKEDVEVEVWSVNPGNVVPQACSEMGIATTLVPIQVWTSRRNLLYQLFKFALRLRRSKVDILLPYVLVPNLACCSTWRYSRAKVCIWQQRDEGLARGPVGLETRAVRDASLFVSNSRGGADFLKNALGVQTDRVHLIPNGVQLKPAQKNRSQWREELGVSDQAFVTCMLANLTSVKDHETVLRAWRIVLDHFSSEIRSDEKPILVLAGRFGDGYEHALEIAQKLEVSGSVRFQGFVSDTSGLLAACDLSVLSSPSEGCSNAVLESMATG
ncbi:MAG: glycosyltransferase, partial [Planctomycetota bacterium]